MNGGDLILMARRRAGLTQRELAERIDCRQATIARWEHGHRRASYEDIQTIARACQLQLDAHLAPEDHSWWPQIAVQLDRTPAERVRRLTPPAAFDVIPVLEDLAYTAGSVIVLGEVAGALHGWPLVLGTGTVEVCVRPQDVRLVLDRLESLQTSDGPEGSLAGRLLITKAPPGTAGFRDLAREADTVEIDDRGVRVAALRDLLRIADASPHADARRHALAYQAVLDVQRARLNASAAASLSDEEKIEAWLSQQTPVA
jgi:transcriptional regulator with XRE-family HTH domain